MYQKDNQLTKSRYHRSLAKAAKKVAASDQTQKHHTKRYVLFLCQNQKHPPQDQLQLKVLLQMVQITARNLDLPNWMIPKILIIGLMIYLNNPLKRKNKNILYFLLLSFAFFHTRYQARKRLSNTTNRKICAKSVKKAAEFTFYDQKKI